MSESTRSNHHCDIVHLQFHIFWNNCLIIPVENHLTLAIVHILCTTHLIISAYITCIRKKIEWISYINNYFTPGTIPYKWYSMSNCTMINISTIIILKLLSCLQRMLDTAKGRYLLTKCSLYVLALSIVWHWFTVFVSIWGEIIIHTLWQIEIVHILWQTGEVLDFDFKQLW